MPRVNLTSGQKVGVMSMVIIAALTTFIDFVFHLVATFPMEITTYFVAIFLFSLVGAALIPEYGIFAGAFVFTALKTVYNVLAVYLSVPNYFNICMGANGISIYFANYISLWSFMVYPSWYFLPYCCYYRSRSEKVGKSYEEQSSLFLIYGRSNPYSSWVS